MDQEDVIRGVIFDMDGVLCDSEPFLFRAAREMFRQKFGLGVAVEDFAPFVGMGEDRYLGGVAEKYGVALRLPADKYDTYKIYLDLIEGRLEPLPGVLEFVNRCQNVGLKTAVATSADREKMEGNLEQIGLPPKRFEVLVTGNDVVKKKPDPEIFLTAARKLDVLHKHCLVIEDSPSGVEAAIKAGTLCLGILSSFSRKDLTDKGAHWTTDSLLNPPQGLTRLLFPV